MRYFDNGCLYTVQCSTRDVETFKASWPCSGLPSLPIAFQFDKRTGDLVDILCRRDSSSFDGPSLVALSEDAQQYGKSRQTGK